MADHFIDSYKDKSEPMPAPPLKSQDPAPEDLDELEDEPMEPPEPQPENWRDMLPEGAPQPMYIGLFFNGISMDQEGRDIDALIELVISYAATLGLTWVWGATDDMDYSDVVDGSALHKAIMERV